MVARIGISPRVTNSVEGIVRWIRDVAPIINTGLAVAYDGNPAGSIRAYGGATAPDSWLLCDGSAVSRTTFAGLFDAIGTKYGVGDGSTTFNLPTVNDILHVTTLTLDNITALDAIVIIKT